jgi:hypothetical protein
LFVKSAGNLILCTFCQVQRAQLSMRFYFWNVTFLSFYTNALKEVLVLLTVKIATTKLGAYEKNLTSIIGLQNFLKITLQWPFLFLLLNMKCSPQ